MIFELCRIFNDAFIVPESIVLLENFMESMLTMHCLSVVSSYLSLSKLPIRPAEDFPLYVVPVNYHKNLPFQ